MQIATDPSAAFQARPPVTALSAGVKPQATTTSSAATSSSGSNPGTSTATITANDFLQLLVTELQNQDPTANTDPNEYVNQLVQVNSLQQQIQMNQTLDGGPTLTGASSGVLQQLMNLNQTLDGDVASTGTSAYVSPSHTLNASATPAAAPTGDLGTSTSGSTAAEAVATALAPHAEAPGGSQKSTFEQFAARLKAGAPAK